jgi:hypothetical protein
MYGKEPKKDYAEQFYQHMIEENEKVLDELEAAIERVKQQNRKTFIKSAFVVFILITLLAAFIYTQLVMP